MKRFLALLIACAMLLGTGALTACGAPGDPGESKSQEPITLSFVRIGNDEGEANYWKSLIAKFEAKYTNVKIAYDDAAIGEPMETKLNNLFMAGQGPDLIGHGIMSVAARVEAGHYQPITEFYNTWEGKEDLMPAVRANGTYQEEVYGLAYSTTPYVFAYRTDLFAQAGLDPDTPPKTWDELREYAELLTVREGNNITRAGFAFPMAAGNFVEYDVFVFGNGGRYFDDAGMPTMNTPEKIEAFDFLTGFIDEVNIPYNNNETNPFIKGNAAMTLINNVALRPMLQDSELADKVALALPPSKAEAATFCGCNMLFIGRDCKYPKEAFDFIAMALSSEEVLERATSLNIPVTRASLVEQFVAMDPLNEARAQCVEYGIGMPRTPWAPTFQTVRNDMVQNVLYGRSSPADALAEAQAKLDEAAE